MANTYATVYITQRRQAYVNDYLETAKVVQGKIDDVQLRLALVAGQPPRGNTWYTS